MSFRCIFCEKETEVEKDFMTGLKACDLIRYLLSIGKNCTILGK